MELLEEVAGDINRRYLKGVGSKIVIGDEGAWIGVEMDPKRTKIEGEIEYDKGETYKDSDEKGDYSKKQINDPDNQSADPNESALDLNDQHREKRARENP